MFGRKPVPKSPYLFTEETRRALAGAHAEAERLGAEHITPEHILLALTWPRAGAAGRLLDRLDVDVARLHALLVPDARQRTAPAAAATTDMPYTSRAKRVLEQAMAQRQSLGAGATGSEHLLLGILAAEPGPAAHALSTLGVTLDRMRAAIVDGRDGAAARTAAPAPPPRFRVTIDDASDRSIYEQIVGQVQEAVATGRLAVGERLPPVRELADDLSIAPGTVARAYSELERLGVVITEGARGTRVAPHPPPVPAPDRPATLVGLLRPVAVAAFHLGASPAELRDALAEAMRDIFDGDGQRRRAT